MKSYKDYEDLLFRLTGKKWLCIGDDDDNRLLFMQQDTDAVMDYGFLGEGGWVPWSESLVRDYLNGPYLDLLPQQVKRLLTPFEYKDDRSGRLVIDLVTILDAWETDRFLRGALRETSGAITKDNSWNINNHHNNAEIDFDDECVSPLEQWKSSSAQWSNGTYDEWSSDYERVMEEQQEWARDRSDYLEEQYSRELDKKCEYWRRTWGCFGEGISGWSRSGCTVNSSLELDGNPYGYGAYSDEAHALRPVICLDFSEKISKCPNPVHMTSFKRVLPG